MLGNPLGGGVNHLSIIRILMKALPLLLLCLVVGLLIGGSILPRSLQPIRLQRIQPCLYQVICLWLTE